MLTPDHSKYSPAPHHVAVLVLTGLVAEGDVQTLIREVKQKLALNERVGIVADITGWADITESVLQENFRFQLSMLGELQRIPKIAVVSDKRLTAALVKTLSPLLPSEIRVFAPGEEQLALDFASDTADTVDENEGAVRPISTHRQDLLAFEIDGTATTRDVQRVSAQMMSAFKHCEKIDLLVRIKDYGFDPQILNMESWLAMKTQSFKQVRRYAVVGAKDWMKTIISAVNAFTDMDIRTFDLDEEHLAWAWLGAEPSSAAAS